MTTDKPSNLPASVRQRLLNLSRTRREDFNLLLARYAIERCLYRLSRTRHGDQFVLKGAMLFGVWTDEFHRPTKDLDLLAFGDPSAERLHDVFADICAVDVEHDGLVYQKETIRITEIREDDEYRGHRVELQATLAKMRISLQVDVGFGDTVGLEEPGRYPTLLSFRPPLIRMYPKEYVISEKLQAMVALEERNSRMKDFYDLWFMSNRFPFEGVALRNAIYRTFERRKTPLPATLPVALSALFSESPLKITQWEAFLKRLRLEGGDTLGEVVQGIGEFLMPVLTAAARGEPFDYTWPPGGPWRKREGDG